MIIVFTFICLCWGCSSNPGQGNGGAQPEPWVVPPADLDPPPWPEWALTQWVWEDEGTRQSAQDLVDGYLFRSIPAGAVIIDSPWETGYNTFVFDTDLYPDPEGMIRAFHEKGIRVILWIVSMINTDSPNFEFARDSGYCMKDSRGECHLVEWWKGDGIMLDYTNPEALAWWHEQMDPILDMGVDGWKTDGTDFSGYVLDLFLGGMYGHGGRVAPAEYSDLYYRDFFAYTRERLGPDRIITARPVDSYATPFQLPFAPGDVNLAGWVGDQDPTFEGLKNALFNIFASATRKFPGSDKAYVNFGSDIGGYRGDDLRDKELFIRWAQFGALCPIMENGGSGEHRPWRYDAETLAIYTEFSCLHHQLLPYLYSKGAEAYEQGAPLMAPQGKWSLQGNRWDYLLGDSLFVAALVEPGGSRTLQFPEGQWLDLMTGEPYTGGRTYTRNFSLGSFPVFVRRGEILPVGGPGGCEEAGLRTPGNKVTLMLYPESQDTFRLYEENGPGALISYRAEGDGLSWEISASDRDFVLWVRDDRDWSAVTVEPWGALPKLADIEALGRAEQGWVAGPAAGGLWVKPGAAARGLRVRCESR